MASDHSDIKPPRTPSPATRGSPIHGMQVQESTNVEDARSLASIELPIPNAVSLGRAEKTFHPLSLAVIAPLMPASVLGVLTRLGLDALATYDGRSIFPLAYPQALGCLVMGICLPLKDPISSYYSPLYIAITTGFCGSLTTFSGWQLDVFYSWINEGQFHRNGLRNAVDAFAKIFFTLSISLASLFFGVYLGTALLPYISKTCRSSLPRPWIVNVLNVLSVIVYLATFPTYFTLSASFRHQATAALLFSFPGTFTRYALSISLNSRSTLLPVGTLVANEFGTSLLALLHILQGLSNPVSPNACSILQGLGDGYCGCLTTVSTFAAEMRAFTARKRWLYGTISIVMGQILLVLILGSTVWAGNVSARTSCTFVA
ncbi:CrcB-like protein-domain-containing protein [Lactarius akahatsu]|uniref:CrcB-like protein-domain-containing protein n=1 Tax=Lactarius akahatsu TaxID=416441 RepID=A0AAD4LTM3_9AGAM|nr:CrcB-like protein-domain-containing protein [Lactarius akahatsu]